MELCVVRKLVMSASVAVILFAFSDIPVMAESIFLKDGSIVNGSIVTDAAASVTIRLEDKTMKKILRNDIMRILYTKLKMGKIYIQKRDGKGIVAFIVDEDQDSYTFRTVLNSVEEFNLKRSDILFMAEKNPSGLQVEGVPGTDTVSLKWLPPYDEVKKYNVYIKKNESDSYELIDSTKEKSITLKGLSLKTGYLIIVKAVDMSDYESFPSNEIKIMTSVRVDVQLKDGKTFKSYIVTEDNNKYIFRDELEKAEEFTVKKSDILYIQERSPSSLRGKLNNKSIDLEWIAPYDVMTEYNVYTKKKGGEYQLAATTAENSCSIKELAGSTEYTIKVIGIGKDKIATGSSNELKISTKNMPPTAPVITSAVKTGEGEKKIAWADSIDSDGRVEKYRIYGTKDDKREKIAEVKETSYIIKNVSIYNNVEITAVDEIGDESDPAKLDILGKLNVIGFCPGVIIPLGKFGKMAEAGFGGMFSYAERNVLIEGFEAGIGAGFYYQAGKDLLEAGKPCFNAFMMAPLLINTLYRIQITENFSIAPGVSFGAVYINAEYMIKDPLSMNDMSKTLNIIDPAALFGIGVEYRVTELFSISFTGQYGMFIEKSGAMSFLTAGAGLNYIF